MIEVLEIEMLDVGHITNSYLYYNENKEALLIDAPDKADIILAQIKELGVDLKYILLTHGHIDHTHALNELMEKTEAIVVASKLEKRMLNMEVSDCSPYFGLKQIKRDVDKMKFVDDGDILELGDTKVQVVSTPGHTIGSTSYYIEKDNILFTGDALFSNCPGRWDLDTASVEDTVDTVIKLYSMFKKQNVTIYPGHNEYGVGIKDTFFPVSRIIFNNTGLDISMALGGENESF